MCSIDVRAIHLTRRSNRAFYGKQQLPATVGLERHPEQYRWLQCFIRRKYRIWIKSGNVHTGMCAKFYGKVWSDASIVLYIQCAIPEKIWQSTNIFAKVSFGNRRRNQITTEGSATYIKNEIRCHLDLKLNIKFIAFSYVLLHIIFCGLPCRHPVLTLFYLPK